MPPKNEYCPYMADGFFGVFWIACLVFMILGIFGISNDRYKETSKENQQSVRTVLIIISVVVTLTAIATIF